MAPRSKEGKSDPSLIWVLRGDSGWPYIFSLDFCMSLFLYLLSLQLVWSVPVRFWAPQEVWFLSSASCFLLQNLFQYFTHTVNLIDNYEQTDLFLPRNGLKLYSFSFCPFFLVCFMSLYAKSVTLICSVVHKGKRSLELTQIWNSKEMGHPNWSQQCEDFMHKRSPCFVSGHLLLVTVIYFLFPTIMDLIFFRVALKDP